MVSDKKILKISNIKFCYHGNQTFYRNQNLSGYSKDEYGRIISLKFHQNWLVSEMFKIEVDRRIRLHQCILLRGRIKTQLMHTLFKQKKTNLQKQVPVISISSFPTYFSTLSQISFLQFNLRKYPIS